MLEDNIHQLSSHRAICKQWSVLAAIAILLAGALGRLDTISVLLAAAPIVLLGLAEAGYAAREAYLAEQINSGKTDELPAALRRQPVLAGIRCFVSAMCALSIWPFYLVLWGILTAGAVYLPRHMPITVAAAVPTPSPIPFPSGTNYGQPGYPPGMFQRPANGAPHTGPYPGMPIMAPRTPSPGVSRPVTPTSFGTVPPAHPAFTPKPPAATTLPSITPASPSVK